MLFRSDTQICLFLERPPCILSCPFRLQLESLSLILPSFLSVIYRRCEPGLAYYNETTTSLNSDSSISYFLYPEHPLFAPIEDPTRHPLYHLRLPNQIRLPLLEKVFPFVVRGFLVPGLFVTGFLSRSSSSTAIFV